MSKEPLLHLCFILLLLCIMAPMYFSRQAHAQESEIIVTHFSRQAQVQASEINVTDAEYVSTNSTTYSAGLISAAQNVTSRIVVEYAESLINLNLSASSSLNQAAGGVSSRIVVEYAESLFEYDLQNAVFPTAAPRITVEYAESLFVYKLQNVTVPRIESMIVVEYADSVFAKSMKRPPVPLTSPPATNISMNGAVGSEGWYTSDVVVNLSADTLVNKTEYSFDNAEWVLYTTPFTITKEGNNYVYYRSVDTAGNTETVRTATVKVDKTPPSGSISINNGATSTSSWSVTLVLNATDKASGVSQMCFAGDASGDPIYTAWEPFAASKDWTLSLDWQRFLRTQNSTATVYVGYVDRAGLVSLFSDTIIMDVRIPSPVTLNSQANVTASSVLLSWTRSNDPDFLCYQVRWSLQQSAPSTGYVNDRAFINETSGELIYDPSVVGHQVEGLSSSTTYYFIVRTFNQQGIYADSNLMTAKTASGPIIPFLPWSLDTIIQVFGAIVVVSATGLVTPRAYRKWKAAKETQSLRLIEDAEKSSAEGDVAKTMEYYAKAFTVSWERKQEKTATSSIHAYINLAETSVCQAALKSDKKLLERISKIHETLRTNKSLAGTRYENRLSQMNTLVEKARNNDLDYVATKALDDIAIQKTLTSILDQANEIEIKDVATKSGYTPEAIHKLVSKGVESQKIKGFLTTDGQKFVTESQLRRKLEEEI